MKLLLKSAFGTDYVRESNYDLSIDCDSNTYKFFSFSPREPPKPRLILNHVNGHFKSGELVALMGPSGAGKTTLLDCLIGKRERGLTGRISVTRPKLRMAIVPQIDHLLPQFTVKESIIWASRMKNWQETTDHEQVAEKVIEDVSPSKIPVVFTY